MHTVRAVGVTITSDSCKLAATAYLKERSFMSKEETEVQINGETEVLLLE
jgi:hypothetical protein